MLSGINHGANLGEDVTYSGTVAAAMEATLFKVPAIAMSQVCASRQHINGPTAERFAPEVIERLLSMPWPEDVLVNVNFPDLDADEVRGHAGHRPGQAQDRRHAARAHRPARRALSLDRRPARDTSVRAREPTSRPIAAGYVSITPVHLDMTHHAQPGQALRAAGWSSTADGAIDRADGACRPQSGSTAAVPLA